MPNDIPTLLAEFLASRRETPFQWGANDCCLFAADWLVACGLPDLMADFRGTYSDARGAIRAWGSVGGYEPEGHTRLLGAGLTAVPYGLAPRGSIALVPTHKNHHSYGVLDGTRIWLLSPVGLTAVSSSTGAHFWRIN